MVSIRQYPQIILIKSKPDASEFVPHIMSWFLFVLLPLPVKTKPFDLLNFRFQPFPPKASIGFPTPGMDYQFVAGILRPIGIVLPNRLVAFTIKDRPNLWFIGHR